MKIIAIGVHPDDIEFGMGATLAKHIKMGHDVSIIVLTDGARDEKGNYQKSEERREESIKALKILGLKEKPKFLDWDTNHSFTFFLQCCVCSGGDKYETPNFECIHRSCFLRFVLVPFFWITGFAVNENWSF